MVILNFDASHVSLASYLSECMLSEGFIPKQYTEFAYTTTTAPTIYYTALLLLPTTATITIYSYLLHLLAKYYCNYYCSYTTTVKLPSYYYNYYYYYYYSYLHCYYLQQLTTNKITIDEY